MLDKSLPFFGVLMTKTDTQSYPRFGLPDGFSIAGYRPGFEADWANLQYITDQTDTLGEAADIFKMEFLSRPELLSERCLFVLNPEGKPVATASLWPGEHFGKTRQRIHWVSALPEYQGKGLVKALLSGLLELYNALGCGDFIYLTTQTWSCKAINLYEKFGFEPYKGKKPDNWSCENFEERNQRAWRLIDDKLAEYRESGKLSFEIHKAVPSEAIDVARVLTETWKAAYRDIIPSDALKKYTDLGARKERIESSISSGEKKYFLALSGGQPCGVASFGPSRNADREGYGEIYAIYALEKYWGKGVGQRLMDFALSELSRLGYKRVFLWVLEKNSRARRFYEKCGFTFDGTARESGFKGDAAAARYERTI